MPRRVRGYGHEKACSTRHRHIGTVALAATAGIAPASASGGHFDGKPVIRVIAKGLDHPRRLSYDHGRLYVAEAGRGGKMCLGEGPEGPTCIGLTAAVSKVFREGDAWKHHRLVDGPSSAGAPDGGFAVGLNGVSARHGSVWGVETRAPPEARVPTAPPWNKLGKLLSIDRGRARIAADISAVELKYNPHKTAVDSNPYAVPALPDGRGIVADAAGNDLIVVSRSGRARPFTVFRDHDKHEAVPASLALGPDGNLYVGELNGEPAKPTARVAGRPLERKDPRLEVRLRRDHGHRFQQTGRPVRQPALRRSRDQGLRRQAYGREGALPGRRGRRPAGRHGLRLGLVGRGP
ncbi:ScyD/ScyE family protein [Streptomyces sp. NBC_00079]|uniref:ScyD/ScyE family protein n=1 Tax=Streptomyces sp. NBC_00079 TaxID=2975644 RepID=UPI00324D8642